MPTIPTPPPDNPLHDRARRVLSETKGLITLLPDMSPEDALRYMSAMVARMLEIATELHLECESVKREIKRLVPKDLTNPDELDY